MKKEFPAWFVANCPPANAEDAGGDVYRFVQSKDIKPAEFLSYHETGERPNACPCQRCGLSVFKSAGDVRKLLHHLWRTYPQKEYGPHIVKRNLSAADGKMKQTNSPGHHTWWAYADVKRHASFAFVETVQKI